MSITAWRDNAVAKWQKVGVAKSACTVMAIYLFIKSSTAVSNDSS